MFVVVMSKLRYREHISLHEVYQRIITSTEFKNHRFDTPSTGKLAPTQITQQNLELLKRILLPSSSVYIIQEDRMKLAGNLIYSYNKPVLL